MLAGTFIRRTDGLAVALLAAVLVFLFHKVPGGFWRHDDPDILLHAMQSPGLTAFFDPEDWQNLSAVHLTPWATFSYKLDLCLFGLTPAFFYVHQLLSLAWVTLVLYALARHALSWPWALAVGLLFLLGAPTAHVAEVLMTRHYVEGFAFALMATMAFWAAEREYRLRWAVVGAVLYALATTAKETYVPLPLVLLCLPQARADSGAAPTTFDWRARVRCLAPYMLVALLYMAWRYYMLGALLAGHMTQSGKELEVLGETDVMAVIVEKMRLALRSFAHIPALLFGQWWAWPTSVFFVALLFALWQRPRWVFLALALSLALFGPLLPLAVNGAIYEPGRYVFLLWGVFSLLSVLLIRRFGSQLGKGKGEAYLLRPFLLFGLYAALFLPAAMHQSVFAKLQSAGHDALDVQGRFIMEKSGGACLMFLQEPAAMLIDKFCGIRKLGGEACPQVFFQGVPLERPCGQWFAYDSKSATVTETTEPIVAEADMRRPLRVEVSADDGMLRWALGPYTEGSYYLVASTYGRMRIPWPTGASRISSRPKPLVVRVQYESPEGWKTISPLLTVSRGKPLIWERKVLPNEP